MGRIKSLIIFKVIDLRSRSNFDYVYNEQQLIDFNHSWYTVKIWKGLEPIYFQGRWSKRTLRLFTAVPILLKPSSQRLMTDLNKTWHWDSSVFKGLEAYLFSMTFGKFEGQWDVHLLCVALVLACIKLTQSIPI